jgi:signal transduction histidine kinase
MVGSLDYRTLFLASAIVAAALLLFLAIQNRRPYPGFFRIVFAVVILTVAVVVADLKGFVSDAIWGIQITFLSALGLIDGGIRSFCATPRRGRWPVIYIMAAVLIQTFLFLTRPLYVRIIVSSLLCIPIFVDASLPLLREPPRGCRFSYRFMAATFMLGCVAAGVRIVGVLSLELKHAPYFSTSPANTIFFCLVMFLLLGLGFGMTALTYERLVAELNAVHEQFVAESNERVNVELRLARAERLAAVGRLGGGVAHFFNNCLCSIQLACSMIRLSLSKGTPVVSCLDAIDEAVRSGADLTQRLLQYAQAKSLWPSQINLLLLLEEILPALRTTAGESVEVTTSNSCPIPPVELDVELLKEAILAIVQNARDAMPDGGKLAISLRTEELDPGRAKLLDLVPGSFVALSFTDTGSGMDDKVIRRLFEPFFSTKTLARAEGLALASAFGFSRQSGGTITVSSTPQRGSTFELHLPILNSRQS